VIDCPSLTNQGKSSADINLALDAVDALSSPPRYDEYLIFSADADFTALALGCRAADPSCHRRGNAHAPQAACDA
jgi:hypothetical protein